MALGDLTIRTTVTPDLTINVLKSTKEQGGSLPLSILRPSFDLDVGTGSDYHFAPYGEPTATITAGVVLGVLLVLALMFYIGRRA